MRNVLHWNKGKLEPHTDTEWDDFADWFKHHKFSVFNWCKSDHSFVTVTQMILVDAVYLSEDKEHFLVTITLPGDIMLHVLIDSPLDYLNFLNAYAPAFSLDLTSRLLYLHDKSSVSDVLCEILEANKDKDLFDITDDAFWEAASRNPIPRHLRGLHSRPPRTRKGT